jgi:hypothetical protein
VTGSLWKFLRRRLCHALCHKHDGVDKSGFRFYERWISYREFEQILLSLGASRSDVQRRWPYDGGCDDSVSVPVESSPPDTDDGRSGLSGGEDAEMFAAGGPHGASSVALEGDSRSELDVPGRLPERVAASSLVCQQKKEPCGRDGTVLVRERLPGNPYRDLMVCEHHADEMVEAKLYFRVQARADNKSSGITYEGLKALHTEMLEGQSDRNG